MLLELPPGLLMVGTYIPFHTLHRLMHFGVTGYVTVWSIADEEREYELQGNCSSNMVVSLVWFCVSYIAHNDGVTALRFSPGLFIGVLHLFGIVLLAPTSDGSRLCTCGGDGIVRVVDPTAKVEVISKRAPEILQLVYCCIGWSLKMTASLLSVDVWCGWMGIW